MSEIRAWNEPVLIAWEDHHSKADESEWAKPTAPEDLKPLVIRSVGFIVSENDQMIELARDAYLDDSNLIVSGHMRILKKCIVLQVYLRSETECKVDQPSSPDELPVLGAAPMAPPGRLPDTAAG